MYVAARVDMDRCNGCRLCVLSCPDPNVIVMNSKKADVDQNRCKGCGLCAEACPKGALAVN